MTSSPHFLGTRRRVLPRVAIGAVALSVLALLPRAALAQSFFEDQTELKFPAPGCVVEATEDDPDLPAKRLGCYTNFLVLSDLDADRDLDIVMANGGGYYVRDVAEETSVYVNDGEGLYTDASMSLLGGTKSRLRQVAIADVDGDGDKDLYLPGGYGADADQLFIQTAPAVFEDQADARLPPFTWSNAGSAHFGDLDGDGDLDLVVGDWGAAPLGSPGDTLIYMNDGAGTFTAGDEDYVPLQVDPMVGRTPIDLDLADVDGDFDMDILVNHRNGLSRIFLNDGAAQFTEATEGSYPEKKGPYTYNVEACDYDEDGDLDLLLDNAGGQDEVEPFLNLTQVLNNDGEGHFEDVTAATISGEPYADDNAVKCADVNGDGHYDLLVASLTNPGEKLLLNDGAAKFAYVEGAFPAIEDPTLGIDVADVDGDGKLDVVTGQGETGFFGILNAHIDRIYLGAGDSVADTTPPKFRAIETPSAVAGEDIIVRFAVTDAYTSETGEHVHDVTLTYAVGEAEEDTVPATFIGGDLFRAVIPAQPAGAEVAFSVSATDGPGETASSEPVSFTVAAAAAGGGGAGGEGGAPPAPTEGGAGGATPTEGEAKTEDDGCGCAVPGGAPSSSGAGVALLLGLTAWINRRRRTRA
ncbi:MAG: hypothetical protein K0R38_7196 [Polyangiaceae bacterium]|nr:hypothetical protein [Polyangiaceae bacterium]